jgi:TRAP-type C4-dicarboxylate transport system substrate-binding protein
MSFASGISACTRSGSDQLYEVQKHPAITRQIYSNMIHTVSAGTWKKLTPEQQAIFREKSAASGDLMRSRDLRLSPLAGRGRRA